MANKTADDETCTTLKCQFTIFIQFALICLKLSFWPRKPIVGSGLLYLDRTAMILRNVLSLVWSLSQPPPLEDNPKI